MSAFLAELQRRNVYKVGAMYAVAGWLVVQVVTQVFPIFHVSELIQRIIVLAIVAGFPVALVLSWIYELTPQGIVKTDEVALEASVTAQTGQKKLNTPPMQAPGAQPDAEAIVHQHLHPSGRTIGKQIRMVRSGGTKDVDHPRQRYVAAGAHVHRRG